MPPALQTEITQALDGVGRAELIAAATRLSERYRAGRSHATGDAEILAYLVTRLPATYAASHAALAAMSERRPDFQPRSLLDLGSGPGTASWAACEIFPSLDRVTLIEREDRFRDWGKILARTDVKLRNANWVAMDLERPHGPFETHDLVVASFSLAEIDSAALPGLLDRAWEATADTLLLIEPGTKAGAKRIQAARTQILRHDGYAVAPCPQSNGCPLADHASDWCHTAIRLPRSEAHRMVKGADRGFEDEKFSYVALSRQTIETLGARVLFPVRVGKVEAQARLCKSDGTADWHTIPSRDKPSFKRARKWAWGDWVPSDAL